MKGGVQRGFNFNSSLMKHGRKDNPNGARVCVVNAPRLWTLYAASFMRKQQINAECVVKVQQLLNASDQLTPGVYPQQINHPEIKNALAEGDLSLEKVLQFPPPDRIAQPAIDLPAK